MAGWLSIDLKIIGTILAKCTEKGSDSVLNINKLKLEKETAARFWLPPAFTYL